MSITARSLDHYQVEILSGNHTFVVDEPQGTGDDAGPCPFDLLLASLASCITITLKMYAGRKDWPLEQVQVEMSISSVDQVAPDGTKSRSSTIDSHLTFQGPLSIDQILRLEEIASRCPVSRTVTGDLQILHSVTNLPA